MRTIAENTVDTNIKIVKTTQPTVSQTFCPFVISLHLTWRKGGITSEIAVKTNPPTKETISPKFGKNQAIREIISVWAIRRRRRLESETKIPVVFVFLTRSKEREKEKKPDASKTSFKGGE